MKDLSSHWNKENSFQRDVVNKSKKAKDDSYFFMEKFLVKFTPNYDQLLYFTIGKTSAVF